MPLQATSGAASYDAFGGGVAAVPQYIEDVFSTYLYTGNGSTQTITNGIDLAGKGGLVWTKQRNGGAVAQDNGHALIDTVRGRGSLIQSNTTAAALAPPAGYQISSFGSSGYTLGADYYVLMNDNASTFASWTFRKQPKFFDVVTYTGNGSTQNIAHNLGAAPGMVIIKKTSADAPWTVWHRSASSGNYLILNTTAAQSSINAINRFGNNSTTVNPTSTQFTVGDNSDVNASGGATYVAYLFAHDAGGFGLTGTDNVISCGSFTTDGSGQSTVSLGYEAQWLLVKRSNSTGNWFLVDNMRGFTVTNSTQALYANLSDAEVAINTTYFQPNSTGFFVDTGGASQTYIYVAIRTGPMKVPTSGTSVFQPVAYTGTNVDNRLVNTGIVTDMTMARIRTSASTGGFYTADRLRGNSSLGTAITDAENTDADSFMTPTVGYGISFSAMNGFGVGNDATRQLNQSSTSQLAYAFKRAASFFDAVCYNGKTGTSQIINHNLGVAPELVIIKKRQTSTYFGWPVYLSAVGTNNLYLNDTSAAGTYLSDAVSSPTSTTFTVSNNSDVNGVGSTFVAYLFATCAGVSKVGSYTSTGTTLQVNCGFTSGARFVLIKRTDSTGDWYVWDTARGIVAGNDPYLLLNSTAAEVTSTDYIDTYSAGFEISSTAPAAINASGGTFIFLAIA